MPGTKCPQCGYDNDPQRVYCHQCGAKLPQAGFSGGYGPAQNQPSGGVQHTTHERPKGSFLGGLVKSIILGAIAAALIQAGRSPEDVPAPVPAGTSAPPNFVADFEAAKATPRRLVYKQEAINTFLQSRLKSGEGILHYERSFVNLDAGSLRLTKEFRLLGYPIYLTGRFELSVVPEAPSVNNAAGGAVRVKSTGGSIGHLPINELIFNYADTWFFKEFVDGLASERAALAPMKSVTLRPGEAEVVSGP